jgi:hypothetical protein
MAGQPPEPSFQPSGQDQALTQGRPAWQQPTYTPPAGNAGGQQPSQGFPPPPPPFTHQDQTYAPQEHTYVSQDQAYAPLDQGYGQQDQTFTNLGSGAQEYQGYQAPGYAPASGAGMPQWQGIAGVTPAATRPHGEKGFVGSLFDFSFESFVTPKIIRVVYILVTVWTLLLGLLFLIIGFQTGGLAGGIAVLVIVEPIFILLSLGVYRVVLEAFMVVFRIYEETKKISEKTESQA